MADVAGVSAKVLGYLQEMGIKAVLEGPGEFSVRHGSARVFVEVVSPKPDDVDAPTLVKYTIPLLIGVNDTPDLYEYIAFHADDYVFGHLSLFRTSAGELRVFFTHQLLGDYIDEAEFRHALFGTLSSADTLDDELQARFGGSRFHEGS